MSDLFWGKPISKPIYGFRKKQTVKQYFELIIFLFQIILNLTANHLPNPKPFFRCGKSHYFWNSCFKPFYPGSGRYKPVWLYVQGNCEIHMINPYWQIMENSSRIFSKIFNFRVVTQAVLLENWSIRFFDWNHIWYVTFCLDEFSSKTACVTTRKMKISEKFLDEFSVICQ